MSKGQKVGLVASTISRKIAWRLACHSFSNDTDKLLPTTISYRRGIASPDRRRATHFAIPTFHPPDQAALDWLRPPRFER